MATFGENRTFSLIAGASWPSTQFFGVTAAGAPSAIGLTFHGVQQNKCNSGEHLTVVTDGETKVIVGSGGIAVGDLVTTVTSGYFAKCNSGYWAIGRGITAAASGLIGTAYIYNAPTYINS